MNSVDGHCLGVKKSGFGGGGEEVKEGKARLCYRILCCFFSCFFHWSPQREHYIVLLAVEVVRWAETGGGERTGAWGEYLKIKVKVI